jgi:hypothetical protein
MKTEDTFSLTSIKEERPIGFNSKQIKLPQIKTQVLFNPRKSSTVPTTQASLTLKTTSQSSVTHDLLKSITERASQ